MQGPGAASQTPDCGGVTDAIWLLKVETEFPALEFVVHIRDGPQRNAC